MDRHNLCYTRKPVFGPFLPYFCIQSLHTVMWFLYLFHHWVRAWRGSMGHEGSLNQVYVPITTRSEYKGCEEYKEGCKWHKKGAEGTKAVKLGFVSYHLSAKIWLRHLVFKCSHYLRAEPIRPSTFTEWQISFANPHHRLKILKQNT